MKVEYKVQTMIRRRREDIEVGEFFVSVVRGPFDQHRVQLLRRGKTSADKHDNKQQQHLYQV